MGNVVEPPVNLDCQISPIVLGSLADEFLDDRPEQVDDSEQSVIPTRRVTRALNGIVKPNPKYALTVVGADVFVPRSFKIALSILEWKSAMEEEVRVLQRNETWTLIPRQTKDNVISTKWVFKVKQNQDGSFERYKARLVANGMRQVHGLDYIDTFSPVVQTLSMRIVLTIAISNN